MYTSRFKCSSQRHPVIFQPPVPPCNSDHVRGSDHCLADSSVRSHCCHPLGWNEVGLLGTSLLREAGPLSFSYSLIQQTCAWHWLYAENAMGQQDGTCAHAPFVEPAEGHGRQRLKLCVQIFNYNGIQFHEVNIQGAMTKYIISEVP